MRDWLSDLWPASFKGVPFWVEKDMERGGRRLAVHQFPNRDDPYIEDLGSEARRYELVAYVASDSADADASALVGVFDSAGAGLLVLPMQGPTQAWCHTFSRDRERDRAGYVAFQVAFVRDGASSSIVSADYLAQLVFDAAAGVASAAASAAPLLVDLVRRPGWMAGNVVSELQGVAATLETVRAGAVLAAADSASLATRLNSFYASIPPAASSVTGLDATILAPAFAIAGDLAAAMTPVAATAAFTLALGSNAPPAPSGQSGSSTIDYANRVALWAIGDLVLLSALTQATISAPYASRDDAVAARAPLLAAFDAGLNAAAGGLNADVYVAIENLRDAATRALAAVAANLSPLTVVAANASMPSLYWAWRLYGDPLRAADLVARNAVRHPSFMPETFVALAS